ncbi:Lrp/AsnC family transcriptional regulator [Chloroflexota bacterium]
MVKVTIKANLIFICLLLARQLNVSSATVRRRLKKLIDGNLLHIKAFRDPIRVGLPVSVLIGLNIDHNRIDSVMDEIRNRSEIMLAFTTTGRFDGFAFARFSSNEDFSLFLRKELAKIEGLRDDLPPVVAPPTELELKPF